MAEKPKMALINPAAAAQVAQGGPVAAAATDTASTPLAAVPAPEVAKPSARPIPKIEQDRLYVYVPKDLAKAIRVYCASNRISQSEFASDAFARQLERLENEG